MKINEDGSMEAHAKLVLSHNFGGFELTVIYQDSGNMTLSLIANDGGELPVALMLIIQPSHEDCDSSMSSSEESAILELCAVIDGAAKSSAHFEFAKEEYPEWFKTTRSALDFNVLPIEREMWDACFAGIQNEVVRLKEFAPHMWDRRS